MSSSLDTAEKIDSLRTGTQLAIWLSLCPDLTIPSLFTLHTYSVTSFGAASAFYYTDSLIPAAADHPYRDK